MKSESVRESTKVRALKEAKGLLQRFGYNGFSFQHLADLLGIKKPSLYEHFKSKEELGQCLIENYQLDFIHWTEIVSVFEPDAKIGALFENFFKFSEQSKKICPLSSMITDFNSISKEMQKALAKLFKVQRSWLVEVVQEGQKKKIFRSDFSSEALSDFLMDIGFGTQLAARVQGVPERIRDSKKMALHFITSEKNSLTGSQMLDLAP